MHNLNTLINDLKNKISKYEISNPKISNSSVGWHIEHSLLVINQIIDSLKQSNPMAYKWKFSFPRTLVFTINKIPRGKGKAPKPVQPQNNFTKESLENHIQKAIQKLDELNSLQPSNYFNHPFFGQLNTKATIKFLEIHTQHHIKIINDIIK